MKTTIDWLKTHLDTDAAPGAIVDRLVMLGHDVEGVENRAAGLVPFTVASVVSAECPGSARTTIRRRSRIRSPRPRKEFSHT